MNSSNALLLNAYLNYVPKNQLQAPTQEGQEWANIQALTEREISLTILKVLIVFSFQESYMSS